MINFLKELEGEDVDDSIYSHTKTSFEGPMNYPNLNNYTILKCEVPNIKIIMPWSVPGNETYYLKVGKFPNIWIRFWMRICFGMKIERIEK
jgi:hypothetical protein